jgi:hypothetical protein
MSKLLNRLKKTTLIGVASTPPVGPHTYKPSIPRATLGIAGVAMTVITVAISVVLPALMDSGAVTLAPSRRRRQLHRRQRASLLSRGSTLFLHANQGRRRFPCGSAKPRRNPDGQERRPCPQSSACPAVTNRRSDFRCLQMRSIDARTSLA